MMLPKGIYPILDPSLVASGHIAKIACQMIQGGAKIIQLRSKNEGSQKMLEMAMTLRTITRDHHVVFIVNDRVDIAYLSEADGVHLGQTDLPIKIARKMLKPQSIIGISTHSFEEAAQAAQNGADYIGFGPIFETMTKTNTAPVQGIFRLKEICHRIPIPVVAIGGITKERILPVMEAGSHAAAVISAAMQGADLSETMRGLVGQSVFDE